jgi:hypothetical protein
MPPIVKAKIKTIRIIIYLPKERTVPDDLQHVSHHQVVLASSRSGVSASHVREWFLAFYHVFASAHQACSGERKKRPELYSPQMGPESLR